MASLEIGARPRGGKGYLGWIRKLNWNDPSYAAQNLAMILFAFGGISGLTNASYNLNLAVHNTTWVPGHFHLTVGSATTLTFFGIAYWLVPKLTGNVLQSPRLARAQAWTWFFGMLLFSNAFHALGLIFGAPRRSMLGAAPHAEAGRSSGCAGKKRPLRQHKLTKPRPKRGRTVVWQMHLPARKVWLPKPH